MGIELFWHDDTRTIITVAMRPPWTWAEFATLNQRSIDMIDGLPHRVCYLVDLREVRFLPPGLPLSLIYPVLEAGHANSDSYVIVGAAPTVERVLHILLKTMRLSTRIKLVATMDEGLAVVRERLAIINQPLSSGK